VRTETGGLAALGPLYDYNIFIAQRRGGGRRVDARRARPRRGRLRRHLAGGDRRAHHGRQRRHRRRGPRLRRRAAQNAIVDIDQPQVIAHLLHDDEAHPLPDSSRRRDQHPRPLRRARRRPGPGRDRRRWLHRRRVRDPRPAPRLGLPRHGHQRDVQGPAAVPGLGVTGRPLCTPDERLALRWCEPLVIRCGSPAPTRTQQALPDTRHLHARGAQAPEGGVGGEGPRAARSPRGSAPDPLTRIAPRGPARAARPSQPGAFSRSVGPARAAPTRTRGHTSSWDTRRRAPCPHRETGAEGGNRTPDPARMKRLL
jgi:hypothetical protein